MTLKEKFKITNGELISWDRLFDSQVKIADDYAIEFKDWCDINSQRVNYSKIHSTKELLEIFKKEKGL
jgi:hypothetical protein